MGNAENVLFDNDSRVAPLGLIAMNGAQELAEKVNGYLTRWANENAHVADTFLIENECPRFSSGYAKGLTSLITNEGKLNIINGTISTGNTATTNTLITNAQGATLNISGGTLDNNCYVAGATTDFLVINNRGTTNITGGSITSYGQSATINQNAGTLNISGGEIIAHNVSKGQAIYQAAGTVNISGNAYLENVSGTGESRACVDNNGGTTNITGGRPSSQ